MAAKGFKVEKVGSAAVVTGAGCGVVVAKCGKAVVVALVEQARPSLSWLLGWGRP